MADGLYLYDPQEHALGLVRAGDIRAATGRQDFVAGAPVNLVFVADYSRMGDVPEETKKFYAATDTGFIGQNVYLYCASAGLATVVRGAVDRDALAEEMGLRPDQRVILAQTVGYPGGG
jgi:SagB-type dehydrogenase family enzyme